MESNKIKISQKEFEELYEIEPTQEMAVKPEKGKTGNETQEFVDATVEWDMEELDA